MLSMQKIFCDLSGWKMHFRFHMWNFFHQKLSSPNANIVFKQDLKACEGFNVKRNCFPNVEFDVVWFSDSCGVVLEWRERWVVSKWNSWCCPSDSCEEKCSATNQATTQPLETTMGWKLSLPGSSLKEPFLTPPYLPDQKILTLRPNFSSPPTKNVWPYWQTKQPTDRSRCWRCNPI